MRHPHQPWDCISLREHADVHPRQISALYERPSSVTDNARSTGFRGPSLPESPLSAARFSCLRHAADIQPEDSIIQANRQRLIEQGFFHTFFRGQPVQSRRRNHKAFTAMTAILNRIIPLIKSLFCRARLFPAPQYLPVTSLLLDCFLFSFCSLFFFFFCFGFGFLLCCFSGV